MTKWCFVTLGNMFLILIACLTFDVATCQLPATSTYSSVVFKNIGIKLCQNKCIQIGFCRALVYTIPTLTCQLSEMDHDTIANETQHFVGGKDLANVRAGSCQLTTCPNMRCLETRTGKTECVKEKPNQTQAYTELNTTLLEACKVGDVARVKNILSDGQANINSVGKNNMTPVMHAAKGGHEKVFDLLVREGANLSLLDDGDMNILHLACIGGNVDIVKYVLLQKIVGINSRDKDEWTPVMKAALYKSKTVFDLLVEARADLLLVGDEKETILHVACDGGNVEIIKYLLTQDIVGIDKLDLGGWTPVMHAAKGGHEAVFNVLIGKGADLSPVGVHKETILHMACDGGNVEIIKYLLKHVTVGIDKQDMRGWTPVMHAAMSGHKGVFDVLVEVGADLSLVDDYKMNTLYAACKGGNVEIIKYLLKHDIVNIDCQEWKGMTPIICAATYGHKDVFDVLVDEGADLSLVRQDKVTILHAACGGGNVAIVKYLLQHDIVDIDSRDGNFWTPVMHAARYGHKDVFDFIVDKGADLSQVGDDKETILHLACEGGNVEIIKYLLKHDIVDIDSRNKDGWTPVMHATRYKNVFDVLVEAGVDLSQVSSDNETILHFACEWENLGIIKYLLTHEIVDIDSRDNRGLTPVLHAAINGRNDVFDLLVNWKADLSLIGYNNKNILHSACAGDNVEIVKYLLTHNIVDINSRDGEDCTAAMIAAREGYEAIFFLLVDHRADLTVMNDAGDNILNLACDGENVHIVKYVSTRRIFEGSYREDDVC